jgi:FkbH-like protein
MSHQANPVKCVVWDLDNTIWSGVLLEDPAVTLRPQVKSIMHQLDERGILHSIASRNDPEVAMKKLEDFGLSGYFLYPQINWSSKVESIKSIATSLNFALDAVAFVDDQAIERDEVSFVIPEVLCLDAEAIDSIPRLPRMMPRFVSEDSKQRRAMYLSDIKRNLVEQDFVGTSEDFLAGLNMVFTISNATEQDLQRAEELTVRTHQLNSTGRTYSYDELNSFRVSPAHRLIICGLDDQYGTYGKIGLCLLECSPEVWTIKLLLMSCRVMSRGVGTVILNHVMRMARNAGAKLRAEFISNDRNRVMNVTYKFAGFQEIDRRDGLALLENDLSRIQPFPSYIDVRIVE